MLKNTEARWGSVARWLHWLMAALMLVQVILGKVGHEMARSPAKLDVLAWHKSTGVLLLLLVLLRLTWRAMNPTPEVALPRWQALAARAAHGALYVLMLALPLSGWVLNSASNIPMKVYGLIPWPHIVAPSKAMADAAEEVHEVLAAILITLVLVHAAAALWHHFVQKDGILLNILGKSRDAT